MVVSKVPKEKCCGCYACVTACPKHCIQMQADAEGFSFPLVEENCCINCGVCESVCPIIHDWQPDNQHRTEACAIVNVDEKTRSSSSSGGAFSLIAEEVIRNDGVVFGAAFAEDFGSVHHVCIDNTNDLDMLRGSKYMQSEIGDTYELVERFLDAGREVLFSGTPCQIGGLLSYLKRPYDNLLTQDIVCHGVPSSLLWRKCKCEKEKEQNAMIKQVCFRDKDTGWKGYSVKICFSNDVVYKRVYYEEPFMQAFLSDYCLRSSCYNCSFKTVERQSDITLADFWGIEEVVPEMDDNKGTSLVLIHSEKGKRFVDRVANRARIKAVDIKTAVKGNPSIDHSAHKSDVRERFFSYLKQYTLTETIKKINHLSVWSRIKRKVRNMTSR